MFTITCKLITCTLATTTYLPRCEPETPYHRSLELFIAKHTASWLCLRRVRGGQCRRTRQIGAYRRRKPPPAKEPLGACFPSKPGQVLHIFSSNRVVSLVVVEKRVLRRGGKVCGRVSESTIRVRTCSRSTYTLPQSCRSAHSTTVPTC